MQQELAATIADEIIHLYRQYGGSEYAGEKVTQLEHMVQAAQLAEQDGFDEEVVLAAFLHDIGHICVSAKEHNGMDGWGIKDHEEVGADFLRERGFTKRLARLVEAHVEAKRYLTWKDLLYYEQLSEASKKTLEYQGGPMLTDEAMTFEQHPLFNLIIKMRHWDDVAKIEHLEIGELDRYRNMIVRHLEENN
jgi:phosphonate degradation associated HDIG domain protein